MRARLLLPLVVAGALAATACGSSSSSTAASRPPRDRVLRLSFLQDPGQPPDPDIYYAGQGLLLTTNTYEGLLRYRPGTDKPEIVPSLATSWTASKDNTTFTFHLRRDVVFHDGTPFTSAAVQPSFDRRLAVNGGPAYTVADVASVTVKDAYTVVIKLKSPNSAFLGYLAAPYGPKMMSPTALKEHAGTDHAQTYLRTHDIGTGPYMLTDARVGSHYAMKAFDRYWGAKPYFTDVDIPVLQDLSTQQLQFDRGGLAAILHDLSPSATQAYLKRPNVKTYSLPAHISNLLYVNPRTAFLTTPANRIALLQAIDFNAIYTQVFRGRATPAKNAYPAHMMPPDTAKQNIPHQPAALQSLARSLPANQRTLTIGYDTQSTDDQLVANLISAQLAPFGLTVKVQGYPTSQIYGWVSDPKGAPDLLAFAAWPDASPPYMWARISWTPNGGINYLQCSVPEITGLLPEGLRTGDTRIFSRIGELAAASGCWYNMVDMDDFMVAQPWLKGVPQAHVISTPNSLDVAALSVG